MAISSLPSYAVLHCIHQPHWMCSQCAQQSLHRARMFETCAEDHHSAFVRACDRQKTTLIISWLHYLVPHSRGVWRSSLLKRRVGSLRSWVRTTISELVTGCIAKECLWGRRTSHTCRFRCRCALRPWTQLGAMPSGLIGYSPLPLQQQPIPLS